MRNDGVPVPDSDPSSRQPMTRSAARVNAVDMEVADHLTSLRYDHYLAGSDQLQVVIRDDQPSTVRRGTPRSSVADTQHE